MQIEMLEVEAAAEAVYPWIRRWWQPKHWKAVPLGRKGHARLIAWAALTQARRWRHEQPQEPPFVPLG
jgi:hypothetical protein